MIRKMNNQSVYRMTTTLVIGGMIMALAMQPARASELNEAIAAAVGEALVEQGQNAMHNISQDVLSNTDWAGTAKQLMEQVTVEEEPATPAADTLIADR
ncbi:MAG: hypothetical protein HYV16_04970 [Gammaproteobacteria bacterium]|nr:hypothetical protein [Gammaproteobacteria bacterium]